MELGNLALTHQFSPAGSWAAFRNNERIYSADLKIGPNSIDVSLANKVIVPTRITLDLDGNFKIIDPYEPESYPRCSIKNLVKDPLTILPGEFILGCTQERFSCAGPLNYNSDNGRSNFSLLNYWKQNYEGRSTLGRLGLMSHITAGYGDYGFSGYWTLELHNVSRFGIVLHPGMRIGQIVFTSVLAPSFYDGSYTNQDQEPMPQVPILGRDKF